MLDDVVVVVVFELEHVFERDALPDEAQHGLDGLDREDPGEDLALESGARRAHEPGAVAQSDVLVPVDRLERLGLAGRPARSHDFAPEERVDDARFPNIRMSCPQTDFSEGVEG